MEPELVGGDYTLSGGGGFCRCYGVQGLLSRVLFRLTARRGGFELMPDMGSQLWLLPSKPRSMWQRYAWAAVAEALADEPVTVTDVTVEEKSGCLTVTTQLQYEDEDIIAEVTVK